MEGFILVVLPLLTGFLLNFVNGDLPLNYKPETYLGLWLNKFIKLINQGNWRRLKGALFVLAFLFLVYFISLWVWEYLLSHYLLCYLILSTLMVYWSLKGKSLIKEGDEIFGMGAGSESKTDHIKHEMVYRLTAGLDKRMVSPVFYYCLGGIPLMLCTQFVHYLDEKIGYRNFEFEFFGKTAARIDDIVNFIPSRITAVLIILISRSSDAWKLMIKKGHLHESPNAGYPLVALSGVIGVDLLMPGNAMTLTRDHFVQIKSVYYAVSLVLVLAIAIYYFNW